MTMSEQDVDNLGVLIRLGTGMTDLSETLYAEYIQYIKKEEPVKQVLFTFQLLGKAFTFKEDDSHELKQTTEDIQQSLKALCIKIYTDLSLDDKGKLDKQIQFIFNARKNATTQKGYNKVSELTAACVFLTWFVEQSGAVSTAVNIVHSAASDVAGAGGSNLVVQSGSAGTSPLLGTHSTTFSASHTAAQNDHTVVGDNVAGAFNEAAHAAYAGLHAVGAVTDGLGSAAADPNYFTVFCTI